MKDYYLLTYKWKIINKNEWYYENMVIACTPTEWIDNMYNYKNEKYILLFAIPICEEDYNIGSMW